jgi:eukaryotic-like serine/threonine-protein kinase
MVRIPTKKTYMLVVGLEQHGDVEVAEFLVGRFEVTNKEFKAFINAGGYENSKFWQFPILKDGQEISLEEARSLFIDKTSRAGPATWEAGSYLNGTENHPVTGVSWYEAAAYASYKKVRLPTVYEWSNYAETSRTEFIEPMSNFNEKGPVDVGSLEGYSTYGVYDVAGNAREWCSNNNGNVNLKYILGGGWNDPSYSFNDAYNQPAMDRSIGNGFRLAKSITDEVDSIQVGEVRMAFRDYSQETPVDDISFELIRSQFDYDKTALKPTLETVLTEQEYTVEKATFTAGYNDERMIAYLYIPNGYKAALQPIIFFPGSNDIHSRKFNIERGLRSLDFILKSGRILVYPVLKGTHERFDELNSDLPNESVFYKDHVIMWRKDIGRIIDYLETRDDIDVANLGYLGWSWGGYLGGLIPAVEPRFKAIVLNVGGMVMNKSLPAADQLNFLPRVKQAILMLNGKYDMFFPVETSQKYMFEFLGTPDKDKKHIVYGTGHLVPKTAFIKETLFWFDKYLGKAN